MTQKCYVITIEESQSLINFFSSLENKEYLNIIN
jgi:hypothetical protein